MNIEEKLEIANKLQKHHYFFRAFWDIGTPIVGKFEDLDTAAISFNETGDAVHLLINEDYWRSLNEHTKLFLICHEMLHIVLQHGYRFIEYFKTPKFQTMNIAADVVINEMLVSAFGFNRSILNTDLSTNGCWLDTVFDQSLRVKVGESTEYYFHLLNKNPPKTATSAIDQHRIMDAEELKELSDILQDDGVIDLIDPTFIEGVGIDDRRSILAGKGHGNWQTVQVTKKRKSKWETVIKKWESNNIKETINSTERWDRVNPRYSQIIGNGIHLPTEHKVLTEYEEKDKLDVFFFLDTSGSCIHLKNRFFSAARSLNPKKFNIRMFCFDDKVEEIDIKSNKVYGGGGTCFRIIENKIQQIVKSEKIKYPHAVWVITDGYGTPVNPEKPDKWFWFLSANYRNLIPKKSKVFMLSDYE
jgi:hypothetical protein